jgi:hypothetical protein
MSKDNLIVTTLSAHFVRQSAVTTRRRRRVVTHLLAAFRIVLLVVIACRSDSNAVDERAYEHILPFDTATVRVGAAKDTTRLTVLLAESEAQRTMGLMERRSLAANAGMLFLYATTQPSTPGYWMFRTRIPLDIAFVDSIGRIVSIQTMQPCTSELAQSCPDYPAGAAYRAALEVNAGFFARNAIHIGDRLFLGDTTARRRGTSGIAGPSRS